MGGCLLPVRASALRSGAGRSVRRPMDEDRQNEEPGIYDNSGARD